MNSIKRFLGASVLVLVSCLLGFLAVEGIFRLCSGMEEAFENPEPTDKPVRTMLFEAPRNFENKENFFVYAPNKRIRSATVYSTRHPQSLEDITVEYDSIIDTNNAGLVMHRDLRPGDDVTFVVGDSFTEGQGARSWFYDLEDSSKGGGTKLVNLGIMGTGPLQWLNLAKALVEDYHLRVRHVRINLILPDLFRRPWMFNAEQKACLSGAGCDYSSEFQGYSFDRRSGTMDDDLLRDVMAQLDRVQTPGEKGAAEKERRENVFLRRLKKWIGASRVVKTLRGVVHDSSDTTIRDNMEAMKQLLDIGGESSSLMVIHTKAYRSDPNRERKTILGKQVDLWAKKHGVDISWCNPGLDGFHINDAHPNSKGYGEIRKCLFEAIERD